MKSAIGWIFAATLMPSFAWAKHIAIDIAPPGLRVEVRPHSPGLGYVWVPGYWNWTGERYAWVGGRYAIPPRGRYWAPEHYRRHHHHWDYYEGHWRRHY